MELSRGILLGVFCALSFLIWTTWQQEHAPQTAPVQTTTTTATTTSTDPQLPAAALSRKAASMPVVNEQDTAASAQANWINVQTDVLDVWLDPKGGQVVKTALKKYPAKQNQPERPLVMFSPDKDQRYVAQSGLVSAQGPDNLNKGAGVYQVAQKHYELGADDENLQVVLKWQSPEGVQVDKIFTFSRDSYVIGVNYEINNNSQQLWNGHLYNELLRKDVGSAKSAYHTYFGAAISSANDPYEKITMDDMRKHNLARDITGGWAAMIEHYFLSAWVPANDSKYHYYTRQLGNDEFAIGMVSPQVNVPAGGKATIGSQLYVGPAIMDRLAALAPHLDLTVDYGVLWFISAALFWLMKKIYLVFGNWGVSIILVTVMIKLVFYKLSAASYRSMARMRELQPKIENLKKQYGDDKQALTKATMELYKKEKANPLGGCLPILVQIPVFFALYWVLLESVELRHAPFIWWIHDLSVKDPYFILPLLMGATMFLQQKMSPPPPDPTQAKVMMAMPVVFTVFFLTFPSGLVLYWLVNNTLSILQQWWITRSILHKNKRPAAANH